MNRQQYLLIKLAEEATEVAHIALKAAQFGLQEVYRGSTNLGRIHMELNDMQAITEMLNDELGFDYSPYPYVIDVKKRKVNKYYEYSKKLGEVHDD